jgi:hypothetical protein
VEVPGGPAGAWGIDTPADVEQFRKILGGAAENNQESKREGKLIDG